MFVSKRITEINEEDVRKKIIDSAKTVFSMNKGDFTEIFGVEGAVSATCDFSTLFMSTKEEDETLKKEKKLIMCRAVRKGIVETLSFPTESEAQVFNIEVSI